MADIADALASLRPGAVWVCHGDYASIEWMEKDQTLPTEQELNDEIVRLNGLPPPTTLEDLKAALIAKGTITEQDVVASGVLVAKPATVG